MSTINTEEFVGTTEAARKIGGVTGETITRYCLNFREGRTPAIEAIQVGGRWLIHKSEVNRFKKERRDPGRPKSDD